MLCLDCCAGLSLVAVLGLHVALSSPVGAHRLSGSQALVVATHGLSSCGCQALEHRLRSCGHVHVCSEAGGIFRDPTESTELDSRAASLSPALASRFFTTEPLGKPSLGKVLMEKYSSKHTLMDSGTWDSYTLYSKCIPETLIQADRAFHSHTRTVNEVQAQERTHQSPLAF